VAKALRILWLRPVRSEGGYGVGGVDSKALTTESRALTFQLGHTITLPYGKGQHWGSNASGIAQAALGGWQFSGATTLESGETESLTLSSNATLNSDFSQLPNIIPGCKPSNVPGGQNASHWFNQACFTTPAMYQFGDYAPGSLNGPPIANADFALSKEFGFSSFLNREKTTVQVRMEAYNVFNLTNLGMWQWGHGCANCSGSNVITSLQMGYPMRRLQFGVHMSW